MDILREKLLDCGLSTEIVDKMCTYSAFMLEENEKYNLTRIEEPEEIAEKHFLDSIAGAEMIADNATVLDVGTGAGFPGIPLKIVRPDIKLTVLDSSNKKINFVRMGANKTGIDVNCIVGRAEELKDFRESFDCVVSRAVASLNILLEICVPLVKTGGILLAYKGAIAEKELAGAANALNILGCTAEIVESGIAGYEHNIIKITKNKNTVSKFPRKYAQIKSSPL